MGGLLLRLALGPMNYAASLFMQDRVPDALRELSRDSLMGGLDLGVAEVAKRAGVTKADVQQLFRAAEVEATLARVDATQRAAVATWSQHAGHLGRLLAGVGQLTVDARTPDAPTCLRRLADKLTRDQVLADPLRALADATADWENVLDRLRREIDAGGQLDRAVKLRKIRNVVVGVSGGLLVAVGGIFALRITGARARLDGALSASDPCTIAATIDGSSADLRWATARHKEGLETARRTCEEGRAAQRKAEEEREAKARAEREQREAAQRRIAECRGIADRLVSGALTEADKKAFGDASAFADRLAKGALEAGDLGPKDHPWPCADQPSSRTIMLELFASRVIANQIWLSVERLSPETKAALEARKKDVPERTRQIFGSISEGRAKTALRKGTPELIAQAQDDCRFVEKLGVPTRDQCRGVLSIK